MNWLKSAILWIVCWLSDTCHRVLHGGKYDVIVYYKDLGGRNLCLAYLDANGVSLDELNRLTALDGNLVDRHSQLHTKEAEFLIEFFHHDKHGCCARTLNARGMEAAATATDSRFIYDERLTWINEPCIVYVGFKSDSVTKEAE